MRLLASTYLTANLEPSGCPLLMGYAAFLEDTGVLRRQLLDADKS